MAAVAGAIGAAAGAVADSGMKNNSNGSNGSSAPISDNKNTSVPQMKAAEVQNAATDTNAGQQQNQQNQQPLIDWEKLANYSNSMKA